MKAGAAVIFSTLMSLSTGAIAQAGNFEMKTFPVIARTTLEPACPEKVVGNEQGRAYQEGGYTNDGTVNLTDVATDIEFEGSTRFSVTWKGTLKPQYQNCIGSSKITSADGEYFERHSHLRLQYDKGQVFFTVDMTGKPDANDYTTSISEQNIVNGNPSWSWSGSD